MSDPVRQPIRDSYDIACDEAIAACNGDTRSTIRALLILNEFLEYELQDARAAAHPAADHAAA
jgi:hypothetical protein